MNHRDLRRLELRLPKEPGLHRDADARDFVVFVPLVAIDGEYHLLLEKRARGIRQEQEICFPGGSVEPEIDRSPEETALRETEEELGIPQSNLEVLGRMDAVITHWGGLIDVVVGTADAQSAQSCRPNPHEVERTLLVPVRFFEENPPSNYSLRVEIQPEFTDEEGRVRTLFPARELGLPQRYWKPWARDSHVIYVYRYDGETIWGITAGVICRLVELLRQS